MSFKPGNMVLVIPHPETSAYQKQFENKVFTVEAGPNRLSCTSRNPNEFYLLEGAQTQHGEPMQFWVRVLMPIDPDEDIRNEETNDITKGVTA